MNHPDSELSAPRDEQVSYWAFVAVALIIALFLRIYRISSQSIWVDEMLTLHASGITSPLHLIDIFDNVHGALDSIILFLWTRIAGTGEFALRLPSAVFSVLSLLAIYNLLVKLVGRKTSLIALIMLVFSPFHVWYGQEARNYSMLLFFSALSVSTFLSLLENPGRGTFAGYVLTTFAAFLSNMSMAFLLVVENILFFILPRKLSFKNFVLANLFIVLLLFPWIWGMIGRVEFHRLARTIPYEESQMLRGETTFSPLAIPYTFHNFAVGYSFGPSLRELHEPAGAQVFARYAGILLPAAAAFSLAAIIGVLSLRRRRRLLAALILWIAVPVFCVSFFAVKNFKPFNPRYVMVAFPAFFVLVAEGVRRTRPRILRIVVAGVVLAAMWFSLWNYYTVSKYSKDDFRSTARQLKTELRPGDAVFAEGTFEPLYYYCGTDFPVLPIYPEMIGDEGMLRAFIEERSAGRERIWLVTSRLWTIDPGKKVETMFREFFVFRSKSSFEGVELFLFTGKSTGPDAPNRRHARSRQSRAGDSPRGYASTGAGELWPARFQPSSPHTNRPPKDTGLPAVRTPKPTVIRAFS